MSEVKCVRTNHKLKGSQTHLIVFGIPKRYYGDDYYANV
jgi:hypothetical protein